MKTMRFIFYFLLLAFANAAMAEKESISNLKNVPGHPHILLLKGEEKALLKKIGKDRIWKDVHTKILQESDAIVQLPVSEYKKEGRRLLSVSRENLRRIFFLSYAYRMSGKPKYMERAEKEMLQIASFSDWNPSHFLDVAEMTMAMAIGYDWLYADMPTASRKIIKEAILQKGLAVSLDEKSKTNWWIKASNNWNQVCHAGMAYGALALAEDAPDMAKQILNRAIDKIRIPMEHYGPDGAYPEGIGYWEYGTSFNVMFLSAIEKVFRSDFGLSEVPGFLKTGEYAQQMVTPLYNNFCYADNGSRAGVNSTIFWLYDKTKEASLLYQQAQLLENQACKSYLRNRLLPSMLVWGAGVALENTPMPRNLFWMAGGDNPVCAMRSGWEDPDAIYVGVKAGSPNVNHGHMDFIGKRR